MIWLEQIYRCMLVSLPGDVREAYGPSMLQTFRTGFRRELRSRGPFSALLWALEDYVDVGLSGVRERWRSLRSGPRRTVGSGGRRPRRHWRVLYDLGHALRMIRRTPAYSAVVILTIVLAIGSNAAIFTVVDSVLLRPSPFATASELVQILHASEESSFATYARMNDVRLRAWSDQTALFQQVEGYETESFVLTGADEPERIVASYVSTGLLPMLGVPPLLGTASVAAVESPATLVLGYKLWVRRFGSDPGIVGQRVTLSDTPYTVVGVMPKRFVFPYAAIEAWLPVPLTPEGMTVANGGLQPLARLQPTLSLELAQERADAVSQYLTESQPRLGGWKTRLLPLDDDKTGAATTKALYVLLGAVGLVLLIACANIANLTLSAVTARQRELAVRTALGASRWQIGQMLLSQAVVLSLIGGGIALVLTYWTLPVVIGLADQNFTLFADAPIEVDARVGIVVLFLSLMTAVLSTIVPIVRFSQNQGVTDLHGGGRTLSPTRKQRSIRGALVVTQVSLCLILLVGAGLLVKSFLRLSAVPLGFETDDTIVFNLELDPGRYPTTVEQHAFYDQLVERLRTAPGVEDVTTASGLPPTGGGFVFSIAPEASGEPPATPIPDLILPFTHAANNYFHFLKIPILQGRAFTDADRGQDVVIVNEAIARHYWGNKNPVGRQFRLEPDDVWMTVVGVAADIKITGSEDRFGAMEIYYPIAPDRSQRRRGIAVRTTGNEGPVAAAVKAAVWDLDPSLPVNDLSSFEVRLADAIARPKFYTVLMSGFAGFGIILAAVGLYGVVSYTVVQRTREIGIRMALGARRRTVLLSVLRTAALLTSFGLAIGLVGAVGVTGFIKGMLFEVEATDPFIFASLAAILFGLAMLAAYVPARRASAVDPNTALRGD